MKNLPPKYPLVWDEKNPQSVIQAINENFLSILSNTTVVTTFDPIAWSDVGRERQLHLRGNTDGVVDTRDNGAILTIGASYNGVEKGYDVRGLTFPDGAHALTITDHVGSFSGGTPGQLQVNLSYPTMTAETSIDGADLVAIYDSSAAAHRKITRANFVSGLASSVHTHPASDITSGQLALARGGTAADLSATGGTGQFLRQSSAGAAITVSAIAHADLGSGGGTGTKYLRDDMSWQTVSAGVTDHGALTGLGDDDHTQYALLAGRSGGQTLIGGTGSGDDLTLQSTSHATRGNVFFGSAGTHTFDEVNGRWGFGVAAPARALEVRSTSAQIRASYNASSYWESGINASGNHFMDMTGQQFSFTMDVASSSRSILFQKRTASGELPEGQIITTSAAVGTSRGLSIAADLSNNANTLALMYWSNGLGAAKSALEIAHETGAGTYGNLKLMKSGGVVGIGMGSTTPARALEVRSTSAQQRWSYDASKYAELTCGSSGDISLLGNLGARVIIGFGAAAAGVGFPIAIGSAPSAGGTSAIAIGRSAGAGNPGAIAIGVSAAANNDYSVAIGQSTSAAGSESVAIGRSAATGTRGVAIGYLAVTTGYTYSVALGYNAAATANNQFVSGSDGFPISNVYFGDGVVSATPTAWTLNGSGGSGTNIAGGALQIAGGKGTGNAAGGSVKIQASTAGASGTTLQTLATVAEFGPATIGFYGVTPVTRPTAYTQTYSTADRTLSAYTADNESAAYTGIDNAQVGTVYAQLTDLNALRVAYENLRAFVEDLAQHHNSVLDDLQAVGLLQ